VRGKKSAPKQLVVLSGKGGTGKTSVLAALAALSGNKVLADCDVDAPDLHLVLNPQVESREVFLCGKEAVITPERCSACGLCVEYCRFGAIRAIPDESGRLVYGVDPMSCEGCNLCTHVCEAGAITMVEADRGEWFISKTSQGPMVHARLSIGGENSGKLVTLVKHQAVSIAQDLGAAYILVDGPPGIGCPAIASISGATLVLAVTEPSVSAAHDLKRLAGVVKTLGASLAVCINKADINPELADQIRSYCAETGLPVVGALDYDTAIVEAQMEGKSVIDYTDGRIADQMRSLWKALDTILAKTEATT
jgi:MinD superfamily P-loop ATPase